MNEIDIQIEPAKETDIPALTEAMTRAFDDDSQRHLGKPKGGPPGYDDGEFFRKWMLPYDESKGNKILTESQIIGGIIVWILPSQRNRLGVIFVDPDFQRKGVGSRTLKFIFNTYPNTISWTLDTPGYAVSNHKFYEKNGFEKIAEEEDAELPGGLSFTYMKFVG